MTSVNMLFFMGGPQLGELEAGLVAAVWGAPFAIISGGIATVLLTALIGPRIGPLWSVPLDRQVARSGLADSMSPGDISQLIRSGATAFRVSFDAAAPAPAQRYWRSMIYSEFDGRTWSNNFV